MGLLLKDHTLFFPLPLPVSLHVLAKQIFPVDSHIVVIPHCDGDISVDDSFVLELSSGSLSDAQMKSAVEVSGVSLPTFRVRTMLRIECSYVEGNSECAAAVQALFWIRLSVLEGHYAVIGSLLLAKARLSKMYCMPLRPSQIHHEVRWWIVESGMFC